LRLEVKEFGIDVVIIEPGFIKTNFNAVAFDNGKKYMQNTAYSRMFQAALKAKLPKESEPIVIAKVVEKAIKAKHPKTRYVKGKNARMLIFIRRTFGDKFYDRLILNQFKNKS
jgi:NAD(P)-dependent dehydrogenase (short-subunit alcohol dehydrogenase family)